MKETAMKDEIIYMQTTQEDENVISSCRHDLGRTRKMVSALLDLLEEEIAYCSAIGTDEKNIAAPRYEAVWGTKESVLSALTKLSQLQIRLLPLEQEYATAPSELSAPNLSEVLREECMEALERFFHKHREAGLPPALEE